MSGSCVSAAGSIASTRAPTGAACARRLQDRQGRERAQRVDAGRDVQLPVYVLALLAGGGQAPDSIVAEYRMVRRSSGFPRVALGGDLDQMRAALAGTVAVAVSGIEERLVPALAAARLRALRRGGELRRRPHRLLRGKRDDPRLRELLEFKEPGVRPTNRRGRGVVSAVPAPASAATRAARRAAGPPTLPSRSTPTCAGAWRPTSARPSWSKPAPAPARPRCWSTATSPACRPTRRRRSPAWWPSLSPKRPPASCASASAASSRTARGRRRRALPRRYASGLACRRCRGPRRCAHLDHPRLRRPAAARTSRRSRGRSGLRTARPGRLRAAGRASVARLAVGAARRRPAGRGERATPRAGAAPTAPSAREPAARPALTGQGTGATDPDKPGAGLAGQLAEILRAGVPIEQIAQLARTRFPSASPRRLRPAGAARPRRPDRRRSRPRRSRRGPRLGIAPTTPTASSAAVSTWRPRLPHCPTPATCTSWDGRSPSPPAARVPSPARTPARPSTGRGARTHAGRPRRPARPVSRGRRRLRRLRRRPRPGGGRRLRPHRGGGADRSGGARLRRPARPRPRPARRRARRRPGRGGQGARFFQRRYRYLLVDEFQDTDPLQAEIAFLLAEREPTAGAGATSSCGRASCSWWATPSSRSTGSGGPTSPCTTRSRELVAGQGGEVVTLRQNFRTVASVSPGSTACSQG